MHLQARRRHRWLNLAQSAGLLAAMGAVAAVLGWVLAGPHGALWALLLSAILVVLNPQLSPRLLLRLYRARPVPAASAPELHDVLARLADRAGLPRPPALYRVPSDMVNAFAVGTRRNSAIAVTDALLRTHPHTDERIRRLLELAPDDAGVGPPGRLRLPPDARRPAGRRPRWHPTGLWH